MPSKRTNDSVDRILEDLNMQQAEAGLQDSVTDHQVDEILRSVGISAESAASLPQDDLAFAGDSLDDLLNTPAARPHQTAAPEPSAPAPQPVRQPAPAAHPQQRTSAPQTTRPPQQTVSMAQDTTTTGFSGDTTGTGIIKGFLVKMAPDGSGADAEALNQGKNQFQKFFKNSVAVVPDENGRLREPGKKKRGLFGLKHAEDTGAFVPINVSLSGKAANQPEPDAQEEYYPDTEPEMNEEPLPRKKKGLFGGIFNRDEETEEMMIPEARAEEPAPMRQPQPETSQPPVSEPTGTSEVWRSKYTRPARRAADDVTGQTVEVIKGTVDYAKKHPSAPSASGMTGTIYRKKKNTVEFTPGQKIQTTPPPQPMPQHSGEPVGEPIETPRSQPAASGFTMQIGGLDAAPLDSTQDFMSAYNAVRPQRKTAPAPAPQPVQQEPQGADAYGDTVVIGDPSREEIEQTGERLLPHRKRDDVDALVDTLTGHIRLTPEAPAHSGFTQNLGAQAAPAPAHTGFTQNLTPAAAQQTYHRAEPARPAQPAHSGYTQDLSGQEPAEPDTAAFVNDIANAINTRQTPIGDTMRYDHAAARLTASMQDDPSATRTHARIPTAADVKRAAARFTGRAEDENEDNAISPFDTAEIPVPHSHEYERAEDAPAVRAELAKTLTMAAVAAIVSGVAAVAMILLAMLPTRPAVLRDAMTYPAVMLVLLLVSCAVNWKTLLRGCVGLLKTPSPDSMSILPALGGVLQCVTMLASGGYTEGTLMLAGPAALVLCMNAVGHWMNAATVSDNFQLVSAKVEHSVAYRLKDAGALRAVSQGLAEPHPNVLVSRPTQIFRSFLANSAARGTSDKNQQQLAWLLGGCGLAAFLFTLIRTKDAVTAATVMTAVFCMAAPLAGTLLSALPARKMQRSAAQVGAVIPGWRDIRQLGRINVIQITARDLFPAGCVTLAGIKQAPGARLDDAIVYTASILAEAEPTLRDLFLSMLENRNMLEKVTDRQTVPGKGYIGWIKKNRVLVGNRAMMQDYGIKLPSVEYEQHHTLNQRRMLYLAVSGKLYAMFQVAYQSDPDTAAVLESLHREGLSLVVDCDDFNCDVRLLETAYSLPAGSVKVLTTAEHQAMAPAVAWLPESEGSMLHLGSFASFVGGLEAAAGAAKAEHNAATALTFFVLLSCAVAVLLTLTGGIATMPVIGALLYQAAQCIITLLFPLLQRY